LRNSIYVLLLVAAAAARFTSLDHRPMHADEAVLADKFGAFLATGRYAYDPHDYHGPVLAYAAWAPALFTGRTTYESLTEPTLRLAPAIAGVLVALSPLLLISVIGLAPALWASAFLAVSPAMVYYSRYFIPEMLLVLGTAVLLIALLRRCWFVAALAAVLMLATKETALLAFAAAAIAYLAVFRPARPNWRAALVLLPPLALAAWHWEAAASYFQRGMSGLHVHPWHTYLKWLAITEAPILIAAAFAWRSAKPAVRFLAFYAAVLLAIYSAIPYKTPWCALSFLYAAALLAGTVVSTSRALPAAAVVLLGAIAFVTNSRFAADPRNPWVYAHTTADVYTVRDRLHQFDSATPIDVYSRQNLWPLPWYLRQFPNVRWWTQVAIPGAAAPIVLVTPESEPDLIRKLYEGPPPGERELYMNLFDRPVALRPQVELRGYVAKSLQDAAPSK
jgi:predicted membrane-bound mannosyltransferase